VSDAWAVEDEPTLRRLDSRGVVEVEAVLEALRGLDPSGGVVVRFPTRVARRKDLDDDDAPPTPVRAAIPPHPICGGLGRLAGGAV